MEDVINNTELPRKRNLDALDLAIYESLSTFTLPIVVTRYAEPPRFDPDLNQVQHGFHIEVKLKHSLSKLPPPSLGIVKNIPRLVAKYVAAPAFKVMTREAIKQRE